MVEQRLLTVVVLTRDEEVNLPHLLESLASLPARICIIDSGSTDRTVEIALEHGCEVFHRAWTTYADQYNWGLSVAGVATPWTMRMDADERLTPELATELRSVLASAPDSVAAFMVKRQVWFWGRWIKHGGYYPTWLLRVWRSGSGHCELRAMDEHIVVGPGRVEKLKHDIIDENHKDLTFWTDKHNRYADREVRDILERRRSKSDARPAGQAGVRRWLKENFYLSTPPFLRALTYWMFRYVFLLGFLDGRPGLVFHFLQGCWYRFLVDAKLYEHRRRLVRAPAE